MAFTKITAADRSGKGVTGLPDSPQLSASALQAKFDELGNLGIDGFNRHVDELEATTAAMYIGASVPSGLTANENIQSILNSLQIAIGVVSGDRHTHSNKTVLDSFTADNKTLYDRICNMLTTITALQHALTISDTSIPTSYAVKKYVDEKDITAEVSSVAYPVGAIYECVNNVNPADLFPGGTWELLSSEGGVYRWVRRL